MPTTRPIREPDPRGGRAPVVARPREDRAPMFDNRYNLTYRNINNPQFLPGSPLAGGSPPRRVDVDPAAMTVRTGPDRDRGATGTIPSRMTTRPLVPSAGGHLER